MVQLWKNEAVQWRMTLCPGGKAGALEMGSGLLSRPYIRRQASLRPSSKAVRISRTTCLSRSRAVSMGENRLPSRETAGAVHPDGPAVVRGGIRGDPPAYGVGPSSAQ